jgi:hypothetical protein
VCTFVGTGLSSEALSTVASTGVSDGSVGASRSSSSSSNSIGNSEDGFVPNKNWERTFSIHVWMLPEAILHGFKLLHAVNTLRLLLREHKARESLPELHTARTVSHPPQARAIPVDFPSFWIECGCSWLRLVRLFLRFATFSRRSRRRGLSFFRRWFRFRDGSGFQTSDVVHDRCFFGCCASGFQMGRWMFGACSRIVLLVSMASCLLGDDVLHAK